MPLLTKKINLERRVIPNQDVASAVTLQSLLLPQDYSLILFSPHILEQKDHQPQRICVPIHIKASEFSLLKVDSII